MRVYRIRIHACVLLLAGCSFACAASDGSAAPQSIEAAAMPPLKVADGFKVEKIYAVPTAQGSWISLAVDPEGRLYASAQSGLLYQLTLRTARETPHVEELRVFLKDRNGEKVGKAIGSAHGLLWAFDSLYAVVNGKAGLGSGLYRLSRTRPQGPLDRVRLLAALPGAGEHGPHGIAADPGGKFLYVIAGNDCALPEWQDSQVPLHVGGDQLLSPATQDLDWHSKNGVVPGGWICRTDAEGRQWDIYCAGFRNSYRLAFHPDGELFAADGDNEWQIGLPWYRPPQIFHVTAGADLGWRNGHLKWSGYFPDGLGALADLPKAGPSGLVMGTGLKFPAKYQQALFVLDWAYGKIYVAHLKPTGSTYTASVELFLSGCPLAVADAVAGKDGALYFIVGGRGLESALYRVTYVGAESTEPAAASNGKSAAEARRLRHALEAFQEPHPKAYEAAWPSLNSTDARLRAAARVVLEHQDTPFWQNRFFHESQPQAILTASLALARCGASALQERLLQKLDSVDWDALSSHQRIELLRAYGLAFIRMGQPARETAARIASRLNAFYPAHDPYVDRELSRLLVYLGAPEVIEKTLALLETASTHEDLMHFLWVLNPTRIEDWSASQRERYLAWLDRAGGWGGGGEVPGLLAALRSRLAAPASAGRAHAPSAPLAGEDPSAKPSLAKDWTVAELAPALETELENRNFERGRRMYSATTCIACHYFNGSGAEIGPDLTHVRFRLSKREILESILEPNKVIGDPYSTRLITLLDGRELFGRILCETNGKYQFAADPLRPGEWTEIDVDHVASVSKSAASIMPEGAIRGYDRTSVLDLMAYLVSGGDPLDEVFARADAFGRLKDKLESARLAEAQAKHGAARDLYLEVTNTYAEAAEGWVAWGEYLRTYALNTHAAKRAFQRALAARHQDATATALAWRGLGEVAAKARDDEAALACFAKSLQALPLDATHCSLSRFHAQRKAFELATAHARLALQSRPNDPIARLLLAALLCREGKQEEGRLQYEMALRTRDANAAGDGKPSPCFYYHAACYLSVCGQSEAALEMLGKFFDASNRRRLVREEFEAEVDFENLRPLPAYQKMLDTHLKP